jgi:ubiquinone/menaquinone biosynthesis C-methylase UbiE
MQMQRKEIKKGEWEELFERMNPKRFDHEKRFLDSHYNSPLQFVEGGWTLLDAGCATANLYKYIQKRNIGYTGLDSSKHLLEGARERHPDVELVEASVLDIPFPRKHFNVSYAKSVLEHLHPDDVETAVKQLVKVAKNMVILVFHRAPKDMSETITKKRQGYFENTFSKDWLLGAFLDTDRLHTMSSYSEAGRHYWILRLT